MIATKVTNFVWLSLLHELLTDADTINPRGIETRELLAKQSIVNMNYPIVDLKSRDIKYSFLYGEAWWILSGSNKVKDIVPYMKSISKFSDNGIHFRGAYGPKVVDQLDFVVETLKNDIDSRQALMTIWNRNPRSSKDIPCTISLQFLVRDRCINCVATMRSSDVWLGWVYDVFNFSMIARYIALELQGQACKQHSLGILYLTAGSQHLYESDVPKARNSLKYNPGYPRSSIKLEIPKMRGGESLVTHLKIMAEAYLAEEAMARVKAKNQPD